MFEIIFQEGEFYITSAASGWFKVLIPTFIGFAFGLVIFWLQEQYKRFNDFKDKLSYLKHSSLRVSVALTDAIKFRDQYIETLNNEFTVPAAYPLPNIIEQLRKLSTVIDQEKYLLAYQKGYTKLLNYFKQKEMNYDKQAEEFILLIRQFDYLYFTFNNIKEQIEKTQQSVHSYLTEYQDTYDLFRRKIVENTNPQSPLFIQDDKIIPPNKASEINAYCNEIYKAYYEKYELEKNEEKIKPSYPEFIDKIYKKFNSEYYYIGVYTSEHYKMIEKLRKLYHKVDFELKRLATDLEKFNIADCKEKIDTVYNVKLKDF